jgi:hypothetical protein
VGVFLEDRGVSGELVIPPPPPPPPPPLLGEVGGLRSVLVEREVKSALREAKEGRRGVAGEEDPGTSKAGSELGGG